MAAKSILVIESDHDTRVEIRRLLEDEGHFVISAANGVDVLTFIDKISPPSLILIANSLSIIGAEQLVQVLKGHPRYIDIPIVQLKVAGDLDLPNSCCVIAKPINRSDLLRCLRNC